METSQTIPVVSLKDFLSDDPEKQQEFIRTMGDALNDIGFFALKDHGVSSELIEKAYELCEQFFSQSEEEKKRWENLELKGQRGFTSFGREHAKGAKARDLKEFWHVGREFSKGDPLETKYPANIWPDEPQDFRPTFQKLYNQLEGCALTLLEACALYLQKDRHLIANMAKQGNSILRTIHYPPIAADADPASIRAAAHEDINLITLLCESTAAGLELLEKDGSWRPIHSLQGQIIVDTGDMLQNLTNGYLKSTTHRVVNPDNSRERRFSMPFFVHPRSESSLKPLESCISKTEEGTQFPDISAGEFLDQRLKEIGLT